MSKKKMEQMNELLSPNFVKIIITLIFLILAISFIGTDMCNMCSVPTPKSRVGFWLINWDIEPNYEKTGKITEPNIPSRFFIKIISFRIPYYTNQSFPIRPYSLFFIPPFWILLLNLPYWYVLSCLILWLMKRKKSM